jgi:hypothetical protein
VCVPGTTQCTSSTQQEVCSPNGQWAMPAACTYACVGTGVGSKCGGVCAPSSKQCVDTTHNESCDASGQWLAPTVCTASPPTCTNGNCAYYAGMSQSGGSTDTLYGGYIYAISFSVSAPAKAYSAGMFATVAGRSVRVGIYSNASNNLPNALLTSTGITTTVVGATSNTLGPIVTLNPGAYWIAVISDADVISMNVTSGGLGYAYSATSAWPAIPNMFPTGATSVSIETPDFYVVLQNQ